MPHGGIYLCSLHHRRINDEYILIGRLTCLALACKVEDALFFSNLEELLQEAPVAAFVTAMVPNHVLRHDEVLIPLAANHRNWRMHQLQSRMQSSEYALIVLT